MQTWAYPVVLEVPFVLKLRIWVAAVKIRSDMVEFDAMEKTLPAESGISARFTVAFVQCNVEFPSHLALSR